jgi:peroxiredoxin
LKIYGVKGRSLVMKNKLLCVIVMVLLAIVVVLGGCNKAQEEVPPPVAEVGKLAPLFELQDTSGKVWKLADLKGQVVFVNFWATWCPPCREEMPAMQKLHESLPEDSFKMLSILTNDDPGVAVSFAAKGGLTFPILLDPASSISKAYGLTGVPETYIIDKKGFLRQKYIGKRLWNSPEARQMLLGYINS